MKVKVTREEIERQCTNPETHLSCLFDYSKETTLILEATPIEVEEVKEECNKGCMFTAEKGVINPDCSSHFPKQKCYCEKMKEWNYGKNLLCRYCFKKQDIELPKEIDIDKFVDKANVGDAELMLARRYNSLILYLEQIDEERKM